MGKEGQYDLRLADSVSNIASPDTETEKDDGLSEFQLSYDSHPTKLLKHTCIKMLQIVSVGVGQHGDKMQLSAVNGLSSMFRAVLHSKMGFLNFGLEHWTTFGFLRSISSSKILSKLVTSQIWMDFHINSLDSPIMTGEWDVYKKIQCLRLLQSTLVNWTEDDREFIETLIERLFHTLGRICLFCPNDMSLIQNPPEIKSRVLLSASYSGTIAEELISLLRKLHTLPLWNATINSCLSQKLCVAADMLSEVDIDSNLETEKIYVMGTLNTMGGCDPRPRIGLNLTSDGQRGTISRFTHKGNIIMNLHHNGETKKLTISQVNDCADVGAFSLSKLPVNEMLLNSWAVLIYGPGERKNIINNNVDIPLLRSQQIQLSTLNTVCVLFRHQNTLRKVLRQRSPGLLRYSSESSLDDRESHNNGSDSGAKSDGSGDDQTNFNRESELLIQSILVRATQPSPVKAIFSFHDLSLAALNLSQMLASHVHSEISAPLVTPQPPPPPLQPTLIHGIPIYNDAMIDELQTPSSEDSNVHHGKKPPGPLVSQIMEMGFSRKSVELAIKSLTVHTDVTPTAEQIIQWILEHPDLCPPLAGPSGYTPAQIPENNFDSDSESVTSEQEELNTNQLRYYTRDSFKSVDQYAMYIRGVVCPGMSVRCCQDFEEIRKGDIGTVLKVDTEGLHDLNVQVDWQDHKSSYWMCFVHIEIIEAPKDQFTDSGNITIGHHVRIKGSTPRGKTASSSVTRQSVGIVTSVQGREIQVDFGANGGIWCVNSHELELVPQPSNGSNGVGDLIEDWSRCIRSLTVSSNESCAKHLLDRSSNSWQSTSTSSQGKHWIRLEMHDSILIHSLSITVSPKDCSHMPELVVVRVGDNLASLKDLSYVSVKPTATSVTLLTDRKIFHQWIEIQIKQCRNNGIHCRVHALNIVGRRKQTDMEMMLMKASFLASEYSSTIETSSSATYTYSDDKNGTDQSQGCKVFVWGLNDKEQLGGMKGSKIKVPTLSSTLSQLRPIHIAGGSKSLFVVSQDGKVYACGEGTNGRLGLGHNCNVSTPRQIPVLSQYVVKKVAVHSGGKHALALTLDGKVFSWGEGEDGKLGHGNRITLDKPKLIETLRSRRIRDIACGSSHSAAITSSGELYTWGLGEYGRLGHGDNCTQLKPKLVTELLRYRVVQVACGSRDAQTLALTEDGLVFSWGDGDFGKLGRGGSEGCSVPHQIERLSGLGVIQIECGAQFSLALTKSGEVWTWGKGDYYRLGHGSDQHVRKPTIVQGLRGKKIIHVAVGALHCLAVSDVGQVFAWGDNDHGQQGSNSTMVNKKPCSVVGLEGVFVNRVACGSSHSIAWSLPQSPAEEDKKEPVSFSVAKDPLGGYSLGIYDSDPQTTTPGIKAPSKPSLSENLLSLESYAARQTALNSILNAMSILQARQCIVAALTSHSQMNSYSEKLSNEGDENSQDERDHDNDHNNEIIQEKEEIAQGGGEGPADVTMINTTEATPDSEIAPPIPSAGPLAALQSLTGSLSLSASISSCNATQKISKMSASAMSVMAATMNHQEEMVNETSLTGLDEFTSLLGESEAKSLIELLKLSVSGRTGPPSTVQTIANTLIALGSNSPSIGAMLLETCITELEDLCTSRHCLGKIPKPVVQETSHPYIDDVTLVGHVKIPGAEALRLEFDRQCSTEKRNDPLVIMDASGRVIATRSGREFAQWAPEIRIPGNEMRWKFTSDNSVNGWGWRFWVHAIMPTSFLQELSSDRAVLCQPSMDLVMALLDARIDPQNTSILLRLAETLASCAQLSILSTPQRIWALKKLHSLVKLKHAPKVLDPSWTNILNELLPVLLRQYEYEEPQVRGGVHLTHSEYFKTLAALACDMQLDIVFPAIIETPTWAWFRRYCSAVRVAQSLINRSTLTKPFCVEVRRKLNEMIRPSSTLSVSSSSGVGGSISPGPSSLTSHTGSSIHFMDSLLSDLEKLATTDDDYMYENHTMFKAEHDSQLLQWLNRRPEDWALSWGGASTIYGWGHNHRGQLGGLEGGRIKAPTPCEALSLLRPLQLAGGEQTLFAVTPDGKLFATGYGAGGRLGIGGTDSVSTPTLVESLQHVFVKKVAVNSGGKHCLALTADGEVYSWGEGEDGKLGHGNRISYDRPKLIEALSGVGVVDIACGSAHSSCITSQGVVMTWGKGRYGRLAHGDSDDQLRPKTVEALLGYRAIDIACGSGDAQTLCITDDDNVWSWGDGDYGKLGRGGSDGCKVPMKIESLAGLGVIKVECGSQFSVALTRSGAVYTWGKGDYHRLGHGTVDHVRRPKKVAALQGKKIISIATGSLHCVACSDAGEVFTWGDNDEGQLGDGTVSAIQRPRLVTALQGKLIVKVTCGSAHTLALSTYQYPNGDSVRAPPSPPLEYDLVRDLPPESLHARLVLLHHFSEILCPCLAMLPISGDLSLGALKEVLVYSIKEAAFRKVIQTTMVRDKQHGPVIELNRIQVKRSRSRSAGGLAGVDGMKSVFGQMVQKLPLLTQEALSLPHRVWKVKFVGESVDDCGGGYSESIAEMCDELQNGSVPLLIQTPNGRGEAGANRDCFLLDPTLTTVLQMNMFRFLGVLIGIAVRTGSPLSLR